MSPSEKQTKESCKQVTESQNLPITQKPSRCQTTYDQIRYLIKRSNTALTKRLREGRPSKYCRLCKAELCAISSEMLENMKTSKANPVDVKPPMVKYDT